MINVNKLYQRAKPIVMCMLAACFVHGASIQAQELKLETPKFDAPNIVPISARLTTSGQPSAQALAQLKEMGYQTVIYLAPPTVSDAVKEEPEILEKQGIRFINIPIVFSDPKSADVDRFFEVMNDNRDRKILVHCQINMRGSSMTFLYRVIVGKEPVEKAYEAVARVWSPSGAWKRLITQTLQAHGISFQPY